MKTDQKRRSMWACICAMLPWIGTDKIPQTSSGEPSRQGFALVGSKKKGKKR
jgi:hypothetical protein